ncbi:MAG TPA: hypothetical protein VJ000_02670 [Thermodesulfovibrionia bacterium]|nr:hypothetical protein [Candidatus Woesearchaeota archaeon]HLA50077.1 hypothetical protein [Thermodesulfovibrionia bacterium]
MVDEKKEWNKIKKEISELQGLKKLRVLENFLKDIKEEEIKKEVEREIKKIHREIENEVRNIENIPKLKLVTEQAREISLEDNVERESVRETDKIDAEFKQLYKRGTETFKDYSNLERLYDNLKDLRENIASGYKLGGQALLQVEEKLEDLRGTMTSERGIESFNRVKSFFEEVRMYSEKGHQEKRHYTTANEDSLEKR